MVLLHSSDLLFSSQIQSAARAAGVELRTVANGDQIADAMRSGPVSGLLIDLDQPGLDVAALLSGLPGREGLHIVAYGPHVHAARLQAAREAGCDEVLTRGSFNQQLAAVLRRVSGGVSESPGGSQSRGE